MEKLTKEILDQKLSTGELFVVDYIAAWCEACQEMKPIVQGVAEQSTIPFFTVDIDEEPALKEFARIKAIPMLIMYKNGRPREFLYGKTTVEAIEKKLQMAQR